MAQELTKEACIQKYQECKLGNDGSVPERDTFLKYAGIDKRCLERVFGSSSYSKLQEAAGDIPNKLKLDRMPLAKIMRQYGSLVMELGKVPPFSEWAHRRLKPSANGLAKVHGLKWSELPERFVEWVESNKLTDFAKAVEIITTALQTKPSTRVKADASFLALIRDVRTWTPARRRNSEGEYKIELRMYLESLKYELNEEFGESKCDLLVRKEYSIEVKKDPDLSEYDRLFGQIARHLQHHCKVIVLILEATRKDKYDHFIALVDKYLNVDGSVEVIKK